MPEEASVATVPAPSQAWGPVQPEERIALVDVLRGLALFGIIAANIRGFAGPLVAYFQPDLLWKTRSDFWVQAFIDTFIQGKFITLFAFLFGVGFSIQFTRAEARQSRFVPVYRRRLFALILLGALHMVLFWWGDILMSYGLTGFLLILFRKRASKTVLIWVLCMMALPLVGMSGYLGYRHFRPQTQQALEKARKQAIENHTKRESEVRESVQIQQTGSYVQIFRRRLSELPGELTNQPGVVWYTLPLFLLGLFVFRQGIFQDPGSHRDLLKKALIIGFVLGIPMNIAATWLTYIVDAQPPTGGLNPVRIAITALFFFGRPVLSMAYASAVALLFLSVDWRRRIMPFGAIGRTALSNYLLQTVVCTTIFNGYGGGLFGRVHLGWLFVLSVLIYALEIPLSQWWLAHYRFGPVEWLWRTMTYGKPPAMKRQVLAAAASFSS